MFSDGALLLKYVISDFFSPKTGTEF